MASRIFVTATDTEAGKTWVTAAAVRSLLKEGKSSKACKPIACGLDAKGRNEDVDALLSAQHLTDADDISLYRYALPAAPSQAAAAENKQIDPNRLVTWCDEKSSEVDICFIEGVGGLMVPITENWLVSDWIEAMPDADVWLVVGCKLGAINQTLLTLEQLKRMGRMPSRIFFNATGKAQNRWIQPLRQAVEPFITEQQDIYSLSFGESIENLTLSRTGPDG